MSLSNMKRNLIIILTATITILVIHISRKYVYPVYYDLSKLMSGSITIDNALNRLREHETSNKKLIFWDTPVSFGLKKSELLEILPSTSEIKFNDKTISVNIIYDCVYDRWIDAKLETINIRIPYSQSIENELISYYGKKYIRSRKGDEYFSVWALEEGFVVLEKHITPSGEAYLYLELGKYDYDWKRRVAYGAYINTFEDKDVYIEDLTPKKDSIDILIDERKQNKFRTSIFSGLHFGDAPSTVKAVLKNENNRRIQVPVNDKVVTVYVASYDSEYYENQLASLTLYAEEDEYIFGLETLYSTKYGKTKGRKWDFADVSINIICCGREEYDPGKAAGYGRSNGTRMYHNSFRGEQSYYLTKDGTFLKIEYKDHYRLALIERQKEITDSLDNVEKMRAAEAEKELAKRLATETATGI